MGYGKVLKEILDEKQMSVKTLSRNTGVPAPTIYSIIRRDTPIRYDTALRFANTLDIPLATICNENPYNEEDESLPEVGKLLGMSDQRSKKAYLSNRTSAAEKTYSSIDNDGKRWTEINHSNSFRVLSYRKIKSREEQFF